ncbi:MAG: PPK2 family polyphosphate kinase [Acidimicrobiales bacterium]
MDISRYRVSEGAEVDLSDWETNENGGYDKDEAKAETEVLNLELEALQELLYAEGKHKVLLVLQATDTGGKDGTIRRVLDRLNPAGVQVASFKKPTSVELAHDYLWRVHQHAPKNGHMVVFNRSHYEDVLIVRVHGFAPEKVWQKRYRHIREWERMLADEGTTIIKIFLHISRAEQKERLQSRLDTPEKNWKFEKGDLTERERWSDYQEAFRVMLEETSTDHAPWYVIPADRKWFRDRLISEILVDTLNDLGMSFPDPEEGILDLEIPD